MGHWRKQCVTLLMTSSCNLSCEYCYARNVQDNSGSIDMNFAKLGISDFFKQSKNHYIRFFGSGEPTLEITKIKELYEYAVDVAGGPIQSEIQTNGYFSKQTASWLAENMDVIYISWDGMPELHDRYRKDRRGQKTSDVIEQNVLYMQSINHDVEICARTTVLPENLFRQTEIMDYFKSFGIKAYLTNPVFKEVAEGGGTPYLPVNYGEFIMDYAKEFIMTHKHGKDIDMFTGSFLTMNFDEEVEYACRACMPTPHLTPNGHVSACDMAVDGDVLPELIYGKYDAKAGKIKYDYNKKDLISQRKAENLVECKDCSILRHCAGGCIGECLNETRSMLGVKKVYCNAMIYLHQHLELENKLFPYFMP